MIEGFDKEIDSLLRRAAAGESVQTFAAHADADEISLFAENALTTKARASVASHLADCAKCRKILSQVISLNAGTESEKIHAEESGLISVVPAIPWYRKLFAFPQITFAMGALVLVFAGIMAVLVLQTANDSQNTSVARSEKVSETSKGTSGASSDGETQTVENYSANMSNSASVVNPGAMNSTANMTTANSASNTTGNRANANVAMPVRQAEAADNEPTKPGKDNNFVVDGQSSSNAATLSAPSTTGASPKNDAKRQRDEAAKENAETKNDSLSSRQVQNLPLVTPPMPKAALKKSESVADKNKAGEARTVEGKTFRNVGNIWFDSAYTTQPQIMIPRGSDDYKRLDSRLRRIADNLGGTVVVVWKSKAYRIN
jgi:hypothetical protein